MKNLFPRICSLLVKHALLFALSLAFTSLAGAQSTGSLRGQVLDPSGAVVPGATVILTRGTTVLKVQSGNDGIYFFKAVPPGSYTMTVQVSGFATFTKEGIVFAVGAARQLNVPLAIAVQQQD